MQPKVYIWSKAPFIRLMASLATGIFLQATYSCNYLIWLIILCVSLPVILGFQWIFILSHSKVRIASGCILILMFVSVGALLLWNSDVRNQQNWIGRYASQNQQFVAVVLDKPQVKPNSFKAVVRLSRINPDHTMQGLAGKAILYLNKDSSGMQIDYGPQIIFTHFPEPVQNTKNPGAFDYRQYCLRQGITHQIFLTGKDYRILPGTYREWLKKLILDCQNFVLAQMRRYISGAQTLGLAEALLIGYKDDLDNSLVQSYTNTGVVHIIAISGMHLALIYGLLLLITRPLAGARFRFLQLVCILAGLWLFTLVAGAQASVVRSAVMFTCIALGKALNREISIFHTLSFSAFLLLCYNPYWLWDVGFQLSYLAVLSIVLFYRTIYASLYFANRMIDLVWQLIAISIAAQILTTPISLFYFHQFPLLFLLTNLVAVPLSSLILFCEIGLIAFAWIPGIASGLGWCTVFLIRMMNEYIQRLEKVSIAIWQGLSVSVVQVILLMMVVTLISLYFIEKWQAASGLALVMLLSFIIIRSVSIHDAQVQARLIVYNIPNQSAIEVIEGRQVRALYRTDRSSYAFHVSPAHIVFRTSDVKNLMSRDFIFGGRRVCISDQQHLWSTHTDGVDLLILLSSSGLKDMLRFAGRQVKMVILDGSIKRWISERWRRQLDSLKIPYHDIRTQGCFAIRF